MGRSVRRVGEIAKASGTVSYKFRTNGHLTYGRKSACGLRHAAPRTGQNKFSRARVFVLALSTSTSVRNDFAWTQLKTRDTLLRRCCPNKRLLVYTDFNPRRAINRAIKSRPKLIERHTMKIRRSSFGTVYRNRRRSLLASLNI